MSERLGIDSLEREIRRREADWDAISRLPPKLRAAVKLYIETGDIRLSQRLSGLDLESFVELLRKVRIPPFITIIED